MNKNDVKSQELRATIAMKLGKFSYSEVTDEELKEVKDIILRKYKFNGEDTGIDVSELLNLPNLQAVTLGDFEITDSDIEILAKLESLERIQFSNCDFSSVRNKLPNEELLVVTLSGCTSPENMNVSAAKYLKILGSEVDFNKLNIEDLEQLVIQNSEVINFTSLVGKTAARTINLDGSNVYAPNGQEVEDIETEPGVLVSFNTHKDNLDYEMEL